MTKIVGITGGIGSGKTTVAKMFKKLDVPVYIADEEAKKIMHYKRVQKKIVDEIGPQAYSNNKLNKAYLSKLIFEDKNLLHKINSIVLPEVKKHFTNWLKKQKAVYVLKEAAILFENGTYKELDSIILVVAPKQKRIERVIQRDQKSVESITNIIKNQWSDEEKIKLSDYIIKNDKDLATLNQKVVLLHNILIKKFE